MKSKFIFLILLCGLCRATSAKAECFETLSDLGQESRSTKEAITETFQSKHQLRQQTDKLTNLPGMWGNSWSDLNLRQMKYRQNQLFEAELRLQTNKLTEKINKIQKKSASETCVDATLGSRG